MSASLTKTMRATLRALMDGPCKVTGKPKAHDEVNGSSFAALLDRRLVAYERGPLRRGVLTDLGRQVAATLEAPPAPRSIDRWLDDPEAP